MRVEAEPPFDCAQDGQASGASQKGKGFRVSRKEF